jgi:predicted anti-sigma-YlaC factor YlaD
VGTKHFLGSTVTIVEDASDGLASTCAAARELVSAAADDEIDRDDHRRLDEHLDECAACSRYAEHLAVLTRTVRLRPVTAEPGFVDRVMQRSRPPRLGRGGWLRPALAWCGVLVAAQSVRPLVFGDLEGTETHVARHLGAFALALGIGLLYAAWKPHRAFGLMPLAGALLVTTTAGALLDTVGGDRSAFAEAAHLSELAGMTLLWLVAGSPGWDRLRHAVRTLRVVRSTS